MRRREAERFGGVEEVEQRSFALLAFGAILVDEAVWVLLVVLRAPAVVVYREVVKRFVEELMVIPLTLAVR